MSVFRPASLLSALLALTAALPAQVTEKPHQPAPAPQAAPSEVDPEKEQAAIDEIDAWVKENQKTPSKDPEEAQAYFVSFRDGLLELERKHHGTWAGWQALMTAGQVESRVFDDKEAGLRYYGRVWAGVKHRTDKPLKGVFLNVPRVGMRYGEALMAVDRLDEAEAVFREAVKTELPERQRIEERLLELPERRRLLPGSPAPGFSAEDFGGQPRKLEDYRGQVLLLHFWSGINGPSLATMPELVELARDHADAPFQLLSVNVDPYMTREIHQQLKDQGQRYLPRLFDGDDLKEMIQRHQIRWPVVWDGKGLEGAIAKSYTIKRLPGLYLIGPDGKVLFRNQRGEALRKAVARAVGALKE